MIIIVITIIIIIIISSSSRSSSSSSSSSRIIIIIRLLRCSWMASRLRRADLPAFGCACAGRRVYVRM